MGAIKTYNEIYLAARRRLRESGIEAYDLESRLLAAAAAGKTKEKFLQECRLYVTGDEFELKLGEMIDRRLSGEPVAYITGEWEFYGLTLEVTRDTLIPRSDTEVLAAAGIELLRGGGRQTKRCLDMCTGSGCVGLAIAANVPSCRVILADKSLRAVAVARANMIKNNLTRMVTCVEADAMGKPPLLLGQFDLMVCNPPYIPTEELSTLDSSVKDYEPMTALDGGTDGLDFYRAVTARWSDVIRPGGYIAYECGAGQAGAVADILNAGGYDNVSVLRDTANIERVVTGKKAF